MGHYDEQREQHEAPLNTKNVSGIIVKSRKYSGILQAHIEVNPIRNINLLRACVVRTLESEGITSEPYSHNTTETARGVDVIHKVSWDFRSRDGDAAVITLISHVENGNPHDIAKAQARLEKLIKLVSEMPIPDELKVIR